MGQSALAVHVETVFKLFADELPGASVRVTTDSAQAVHTLALHFKRGLDSYSTARQISDTQLANASNAQVVLYETLREMVAEARGGDMAWVTTTDNNTDSSYITGTAGSVNVKPVPLPNYEPAPPHDHIHEAMRRRLQELEAELHKRMRVGEAKPQPAPLRAPLPRLRRRIKLVEVEGDVGA